MFFSWSLGQGVCVGEEVRDGVKLGNSESKIEYKILICPSSILFMPWLYTGEGAMIILAIIEEYRRLHIHHKFRK